MTNLPPSVDDRPAAPQARADAAGKGSADASGPGAPPALVSVVIPCFNYAHFLEQAIQSALDQDYPAIEVIVVNDGSTDNTAAVVAKFPAVRYVHQENRGLAAARNAGLAHCRGEMVVFLDADDRLRPGSIKAGVRLLEGDPSLGFAAGYSTLISGGGLAQPTVNRPGCEGNDAYVSLLRRNTIRNPGTVLFRRQVVEAAGGFASGVDACADYDLYLRISRNHPVAFHDMVVAEYRKHGHNMSDNSAQMIRQALAVLRRQRPHLATRELRQAYRDGRQNIRLYYGDELVTQIRSRLRRRSEWRELLRDVAALFWYHPSGALEEAGRKITTLWKRRDATGPVM